MNHFQGKNPASAALLAALLMAGLLVGSCGNETPTVCDLEGLGVLEGYVYELGQGVPVEISIIALEGPQSGRRVQRAVSDSTGWYHVELATGLYELQVETRESPSASSEMFDRIRVLPRVFRFDLFRGKAQVRIDLPDDLEGETFHVRLFNMDTRSRIAWAKVTNGWLVVDFPLVVPGSYVMELAGGGLAITELLPSARRPEDADLLVVGTESLAVYEIDFQDSYSTISGSLTGSWQLADPDRRPSIDIFAPDSTKIGRGPVESDGTFTCAFTHPQTVRLMASYDYLSRWFGGDSMATATVFDVQPGGRITGVDMVGSGIQVQLDGPGELAFYAPTITVRDENGREQHPELYSDNPFWVCNLAPGRHYLKVEGFCNDERYATQWFGGGASLESAAPIDLAAGELRSITMVLQEGGRISGTLLRADGTTPYTVDFGLFDAEGTPLCDRYDQWRGFDEGQYHFRGLADGAYHLAVQLMYDEPWWYPGTLDFDQAEAIVIENLEPVTELDWKLP